MEKISDLAQWLQWLQDLLKKVAGRKKNKISSSNKKLHKTLDGTGQ